VFITLLAELFTLGLAFALFIETRNQVRISADAVNVAMRTLDFQRSSDSINGVRAELQNLLNNERLDRRDSLNNAVAMRSFMMENRAFLSVKLLDTFQTHSDMTENTSIFEATWLINNLGKTPAYKVRFEVFLTLQEPTRSYLARVKPGPVTCVIGPGAIEVTLSRARFPGGWHFPVWSGISIGYVDYFGNSHYLHSLYRIEKGYVVGVPSYNESD
jgi:hypothetical protein